MKVPSIRTPTDRSATPEPPQAGSSEPAPSHLPSTWSPIRYARQLWFGELPLSRVFWHDMLVVGTAVNLATMGLAVLAVILGASTLAGIAIHLSPVPYNILLVTSVWRRADIERADWAWPARFGALAWLLFAFVV